MGFAREKQLAALQLHLQEDHDGPISLIWANRFIYLILKFHISRLLEDFCISFVLKSDMMVLYKWDWP